MIKYLLGFSVVGLIAMTGWVFYLVINYESYLTYVFLGWLISFCLTFYLAGRETRVE